jgi:DUF4097 and DUF4098 domain-containing protein YvlB
MLFSVLTQALVPASLLWVAAAPPAQPEAKMFREGGYWVRVIGGSMPMPSGGRLRVKSDGNVVLKGDSGRNIVWTLKTRVQAGSAVKAAAMLREVAPRLRMQGDALVLTVSAAKPEIAGQDLTLAVPASIRHALIETLGGNLLVTDYAGEVQAETAAGVITLDRLSAGAEARSGGGDIHVGHITGAVRAYTVGGAITSDSSAGESWFNTGGGDIFIREVLGPVHASTGAGNIKVIRADGTVYARTAGGVIEVERSTGLVSAESGGGAIQVSAANGVQCQSTAGAIRLKNIGGSLRASTGTGNIIAELLAGFPVQESTLSTTAGDITLFIASNLALNIMARNETAGNLGRIISEFPEIRVQAAASGRFAPVVAQGSLNGGGPLIRISANGGTIYLRRNKQTSRY